MKFLNKSITRKLLVSILLPAAVMFLFLTLLVLSTVKESVNTQSDEKIKDGSIASSSEVDNFFIKFLSITDVSALKGSVINYLDNTKSGMRFNEMPEYTSIMNELNKVAELDKENIMAAWIGDTDSSQVMIGDGFITDTDYDITKREWYMQAIEGNKAIIAEPYIDANTKEMVVSIVAPVFKDNTLLGVFGVDLSLTHLYDVMSSAKLGKTGFYTFLSQKGTVIYNPNKDCILKNISELPISDNAKDMITKNEQGNITYDNGNKIIHGYVNDIGDTSWKSISSLPDKEYNEIFNSLKGLLIGIILVVLMLISIVVYVASNNVVKPLKQLALAADKISEGNLDVDLDIKTKDETRLVADSFNKTVIRLKGYISYITEISELLNQIGEGDLALTFKQAYDGDFAIIKDSLLNTSDMLNSTLYEFNVASDQVASGSNQVASGAQALSQGATEQASSIEELSATVNEITTQIKQTAENAEKAKQISIDASVATNQSQQQMEKMISAMNEISNTSNEIGKIIKNIDDIAFQTNILALNAAVEAARAGSAGKGFAVVAEEVRNLAGKSAESAKITATLIESSLEAINNGSKIVADTAKSLEDVVIGSKNSSEVIQSIADASIEQSHSIAQVNIGIEQISDVVQTNSATAEESAAASEELSGQAQMLKEQISKFKLKNTAQTGSTSDSYSNISSSSSSYSEDFSSKKSKFNSNTTFIDL